MMGVGAGVGTTGAEVTVMGLVVGFGIEAVGLVDGLVEGPSVVGDFDGTIEGEILGTSEGDEELWSIKIAIT